jgi:hypothetical protein
MRPLRVIAAILLLGLASCVQKPVAPDQTPRGFPQPGSPYPYNSPGW